PLTPPFPCRGPSGTALRQQVRSPRPILPRVSEDRGRRPGAYVRLPPTLSPRGHSVLVHRSRPPTQVSHTPNPWVIHGRAVQCLQERALAPSARCQGQVGGSPIEVFARIRAKMASE